jgi:hypothetical protein
VGEYYSDDLDATFRVARGAGGGLTLLMPRRAPQALESESAHRFRAGAIRVRFDAASSGMVVEVARMGAINFVKRREQ